MSREIKFRAWDVKQKKMYYPAFPYWNGVIEVECDSSYKGCKHLQPLADEEPVLMQYIGLKDKNTKEIYTGDIVKNSEGQIGEIKWVQEHCAYVVRVINPHQYCFLDSDGILPDVEIIGSVYETPELLQGG